MKPLVSVIMSVYNEKEEWLEESIKSLINQTYRNLEIILILDNPENKQLKNIINRYKEIDSRIRVIINDRNIGLIKSLNKGIEISKGEYIARLDADDISYLDRIEYQLNYMLKNRIDLLGGFVDFIDENGNELNINYKLPYKTNHIKKFVKYINPVNHPTYLVKRDVYLNKNINGYRNVPYAEDYDFITRVISENYVVGNVNRSLIKYRKRKNSITSSQTINQRKMVMYIIHMYNKRLIYESDMFSDEEVNKRLKGNIFWDCYEWIENSKQNVKWIKILNVFIPYSYYFKFRHVAYNIKLKMICN